MKETREYCQRIGISSKSNSVINQSLFISSLYSLYKFTLSPTANILSLTIKSTNFGNVGELVCEKLSSFGCRILINNGSFFGVVLFESTVDAKVPDYSKTAPSYYGANIMNVSADEFKAVYGKELPPSVRDKNAPFTLLNTIEDAQDSKWGGRIYRLLIKLLGADTMAGAVATQLPIKNFISMSFSIFSPAMAEGLLVILNEDKMAKGLGMIFKGLPNALKNLGKVQQI